MKILIVIIFFHALVLLSVQYSVKDRLPYLTIAVITLALVVSVYLLLSALEPLQL